MTPKASKGAFDFDDDNKILTQRLSDNDDNFDKKSSSSSELSENLKNWSQWAGKNQVSTFDFLHET